MVSEALAVEFETLRLFAVAFHFTLLLGWTRLWCLYGDERVVFEHVLEATVATELDGVELPQLYLASFPLSEQLTEHVLAFFAFGFDDDDVAVGGDLVGDSSAVRR